METLLPMLRFTEEGSALGEQVFAALKRIRQLQPDVPLGDKHSSRQNRSNPKSKRKYAEIMNQCNEVIFGNFGGTSKASSVGNNASSQIALLGNLSLFPERRCLSSTPTNLNRKAVPEVRASHYISTPQNNINNPRGTIASSLVLTDLRLPLILSLKFRSFSPTLQHRYSQA